MLVKWNIFVKQNISCREENELAVHAPVHGARKTAEGEIECISLLAQATKSIRLQW